MRFMSQKKKIILQKIEKQRAGKDLKQLSTWAKMKCIPVTVVFIAHSK